MLKNNTTIDRKNISTSDLVVKAQHLCSMQGKNHWYLEQQPLQQTIIVPTSTILHPFLDIFGIIYVKDTPKIVCNRIQEKNP